MWARRHSKRFSLFFFDFDATATKVRLHVMQPLMRSVLCTEARVFSLTTLFNLEKISY